MKTFTGVIIAETEKAYLVDYGQKQQRSAWIPKKVVYQRENDALYPELQVFGIADWFPINPPKERFNEGRLDRF